MNKTIQIIVIILLLAAIAWIGYNAFKDGNIGSVNVTAEYQATSTAAMSGALTKAAEFNQLVKASTYGSAVLGSVVVASTSPHAVAIYNATSSAAVADGSYGTIITTFPANTPQGTYTFDIEMNAGIVVNMATGFSGNYVITYR